jgi:hypothetical protein
MEKEASQLGKGTDTEAKREARRKSYMGDTADGDAKQNVPPGGSYLQSHPSQPETVPEVEDVEEDEDKIIIEETDDILSTKKPSKDAGASFAAGTTSSDEEETYNWNFEDVTGLPVDDN